MTDFDWNRVKPAHPDEHLGISLPGYLHHEKNRQARIRHEHYHRYRTGWLPCGDNWWRFRHTQAEFDAGVKNHKETNALIRKQGWQLYDSQEPE